ncbi:hypothetical protein C0J52_02191 [Blattella germanica]|nr:hypothetical protein C0J52_02191 [Blattella germanica]
MEYSVNTRPLLQQSESESDFEDDILEVNRSDQQDDHVVVTKDLKPLFKLREPSDRYNLAYVIFYLLGMTTLLPWNFFITADEYWMYKLRDVNSNSTDDSKRTELQAGFTAYLSVASTIPNTLFLILNSLFAHRINLQIRMIGSLTCILLFFVVTTVFVKVDTDTWQETFFFITIVSVVLLNIVSGQALGGIVAALAEIASLGLGAASTISAFVYFMIANGMLLISLVAYIILSRAFNKTKFQHIRKTNKLHSLKQNKVEVSTMQYEPAVIQANENPPVREVSYRAILKKIWVYCFSLWMTFFVTLAMYPAPVSKGWVVALLSILRVGFIPLLLLCNAQPRNHLPVVMDNDIYYIVIIMLFALSNGYLASITLLTVPKIVHSSEQEMASSIMAAFLGIGLACGSVLSLVMVNIL